MTAATPATHSCVVFIVNRVQSERNKECCFMMISAQRRVFRRCDPVHRSSRLVIRTAVTVEQRRHITADGQGLELLLARDTQV